MGASQSADSEQSERSKRRRQLINANFQCEPSVVRDAADGVRDLVRTYGIDAERLDAVLANTKCIIAGSLPLQALMKENWGTDIDIWASDERVVISLSDVLYDAGYGLPVRYAIDKYFKHGNDFAQSLDRSISEYSRLVSSIKVIYAWYGIGKKPVQCIVTLPGVNPCDVVREFDISVCRVMYDGKNVLVPMRSVLMEIETRTAHITVEASLAETVYEHLRTLRRAIKYTNRGFVISWAAAAPSIISAFATHKMHDESNGTILMASKWNSIVAEAEVVMPSFFINVLDQTLSFGYMGNGLASVRIEDDNCNEAKCMGIPTAKVAPLSEDEKSFGEVPDSCFDFIEGNEKLTEDFFLRNPNKVAIKSLGEMTVCYDTSLVRNALSYDFNNFLYRHLVWNSHDRMYYPQFERYSTMSIRYTNNNGEAVPVDPGKFERIVDAVRAYIKKGRLMQFRHGNAASEAYKTQMKNEAKAVVKSLPTNMERNFRDKVKQTIADHFNSYIMSTLIGKFYTKDEGRVANFENLVNTGLAGHKGFPMPGWANEVFYGCSDGGVNDSRAYYMLRLNSNFLIPLSDAVRLVTSKNRIYKLVDSNKRLSRTASAEAAMVIARGLVDGPLRFRIFANLVSADHCQEGSDKTVYRLVALE